MSHHGISLIIPSNMLLKQPLMSGSDYGPNQMFIPPWSGQANVRPRMNFEGAPLRTANWKALKTIANPYVNYHFIGVEDTSTIFI